MDERSMSGHASPCFHICPATHTHAPQPHATHCSQLRRTHALVLQSEVQARVLKRFNGKLEAEVIRTQESERQKRAALNALHQEELQGRSDGMEREMERLHKEVCGTEKGLEVGGLSVVLAPHRNAIHIESTIIHSWWRTEAKSPRCRRPRRRRRGCMRMCVAELVGVCIDG